MKIILRDDDTCYFTKPSELEKAFGNVWGFAPISLAITPFIGKTQQEVIPDIKNSENRLYSIAENKELVSFLKTLLQEKKISIVLHGYSHDDVNGEPEFVSGENLYEKVKKGKKLLEDTFNVKITTFVPPHNAFSKQGWEAVVKNGLNISGITNFRDFSRLKSPSFWPCFLKKVFFKPFTNYTYPYPINFKDHKEIPYYTLSHKLPFNHIQKAIKAVDKKNGVFCLATHYFSLQEGYSKEMFDKFVFEVKKLPKTEFVTFNDLA